MDRVHLLIRMEINMRVRGTMMLRVDLESIQLKTKSMRVVGRITCTKGEVRLKLLTVLRI